MKLLKGEKIEMTNGEVSLSMSPITTMQQARIVNLGSRQGIEVRMELSTWALKNCIDKITVSGTGFDPRSLADNADLSSEETMAVMVKIGNMVCSAAFPTEEDVKKLQPAPVPGA